MNRFHTHRPYQRLLTLAVSVFLLVGCANANNLVAPETSAPTPDLFTEPRELSPRDDTSSAAPARLEIQRLNISMPAVPVGLEADGAMEIPDDVMTVGHYDPDGLGVQPGTAGTAVFAGHVDSRTQGRGALYALSSLDLGDTISVTGHDGRETVWRVTGVTTYRKEAMPMADIFTFSGPSRIAVITCGGAFDRATRSYTHNVVVLAEPVLEAAAA